ncbi:GTPase Der [Candidatus Tremblaya phenacola]|uniref:GTPase Der n=1 Tax=Candidatus Tremblayella phenacoccinincola TaxID=1010676 RepID=A0A2G0V758_9PROT|nr:GTPase Der [Candidatus Tremblaya phenacola]
MFNRIICQHGSIAYCLPGLTADSRYGIGALHRKRFGLYYVLDTNGWDVYSAPTDQLKKVVSLSSTVILVLDAREGLSTGDLKILNYLSRLDKSVYVAINKADPNYAFMKKEFNHIVCSSFFVSSAHNIGIKRMMYYILRNLNQALNVKKELGTRNSTRVAIVGKPNVGKSTLVNTLVGYYRSVVSIVSGTTKDPIEASLMFKDHQYTMIDTGGLKRKGTSEYSVARCVILKTLQTILTSNIVLLLVDAQLGIAKHDLTVIDFALRNNKALAVGFNKCDTVKAFNVKAKLPELQRLKEQFRVCVLAFSALKRIGLNSLLATLHRLNNLANTKIPTIKLNKLIGDTAPAPTIEASTPTTAATSAKDKLKLNYIHQGGCSPLVLVAHGSNINKLNKDSKRHIKETITEMLGLNKLHIHINLRNVR